MKPRLVSNKVLQILNENGFPSELYLDTLNDVECGLHSGFKECCIVFWIQFYGRDYHNKEGDLIYFGTPRWNSEAAKKYMDWLETKGISCGYIPCPGCAVRQDFVKVKKCDCRKKHSRWNYEKPIRFVD